jgi:hypothetical protein
MTLITSLIPLPIVALATVSPGEIQNSNAKSLAHLQEKTGPSGNERENWIWSGGSTVTTSSRKYGSIALLSINGSNTAQYFPFVPYGELPIEAVYKITGSTESDCPWTIKFNPLENRTEILTGIFGSFILNSMRKRTTVVYYDREVGTQVWDGTSNLGNTRTEQRARDYCISDAKIEFWTETYNGAEED